MEKSCGQCKWFGDGVDTLHDRNLCKYPIPVWLKHRVTSGASERLADFMHESWGYDCATFEKREGT